MSTEQEDLTMGQFLKSKEGRGTLVTVIVVLVLVLVVGWYIWGSIFGGSGDGQPTAQDLAGGGSSTVNTRSEREITADLTSQNMTEEAKGIAREFNDQTATDDRLHPVPTVDDIQKVDVAGVPKEGSESEPGQPKGIPPLRDFPTPSGVPTENSTTQRQRQVSSQGRDMQRARERAAEELRRQRREAAMNMVRVYESASASGSMSFKSTSQDGEGESLARVERNADGSTQFRRAGEGDSQSGANQCEYPVVKGGDIRYAINSIALNTDFKGPVKVEFLEGNLKGWIGMGSFELNEFGAKMKVMVDRLIDPTGKSHEATGYVLDPETTLWATASDVDYHIIYRYGGYGLGTVLEGFTALAEARATRSERVGVNGDVQTEYREPDGKQVTWTLLGAFSDLWTEAFRDNFNRPITVTLDPSAELGVLFEDSVCISKSDAAYQLVEIEQIRRAGFSDPVQ
jgi:hypothetical protein